MSVRAFIQKRHICGAYVIDRLESETNFPIDREAWNEFCDRIDEEMAPIFRTVLIFMLCGIPGCCLTIIAVMARGLKSRAKLWYAGMALVFTWVILEGLLFRFLKRRMEEKVKGYCDDLSLQTNDVGVTLGQRGGSCGVDFEYFIKLSTGGEGMRTAPPSVCGSDDEDGASLTASSAEEESGILLQSVTTEEKSGTVDII